ncbi:methyltransferase domain-containing protein [Vibrio crassostreae]|uniref:methyltransferase domain-containing protein n=1 Tax=Vibrio crassostreae TaxID=246167 RepID=UPI000F481090|nr:methyltransferase domain-containing protein [Vibrio crassostreae]ROP20114.1 methyltransferase family protein [Vibrio crassostreae]ROP21795.1 methyltransferase family protein [Vibrio crassostreae]RPE97633.1 methyltransferase family protein [Vibrio crassostreae]RPE99938.1 methyltransferase family protein [Vibrio crassostreae]TCN70891.1 methyltransferase family protein [Vibrio crassostreae]
MYTCSFCKKGKVSNLSDQFIDDRDNNDTTIGQCLDCHSIAVVSNQVIGCSEKNILEKQVQIHNEQWANDSECELKEYAAELEQLVDYFTTQFSLSSESKILEVGSGRGGLVRAFLNEGIVGITACEPSTELYSKAIEVYNLTDKNLLNCTSSEVFETRKSLYDLIIYWHSLEHIPSGLNELRNASKFIGDFGEIIIQVPLLYTPWVYDEHLFFMTEKTLVFLEENTTLHVKNVDYDFSHMFMTIRLKNKGDDYQPFEPKNQSLIQLYNQAITTLHNNYNFLEKINAEIDNSFKALQELLHEKMKTITSYEGLVQEKMKEITSYEGLVQEKMKEITSYEGLVQEKMKEITSYERLMEEKMHEINIYKDLIEKKDLQIKQLDKS